MQSAREPVKREHRDINGNGQRTLVNGLGDNDPVNPLLEQRIDRARNTARIPLERVDHAQGEAGAASGPLESDQEGRWPQRAVPRDTTPIRLVRPELRARA